MNLNEIDYTKTFRFTYGATEYTYNPPKQQDDEECKITWKRSWTGDSGIAFHQLSKIKGRIEDGSWHYVEGSQKPTLPDTFKFQINGTRYLYTSNYKGEDGLYLVEWCRSDGSYAEMKYDYAQVEDNITDGTWLILPTCENNVTLESILAQYAKASAHNGSVNQPLCSGGGLLAKGGNYYDFFFSPFKEDGSEANMKSFLGYTEIVTYDNDKMHVTKNYDDGSTKTYTYCNEARSDAHKHEQQCPNAYANEALKAFTEVTGASVSVVNGTYTILYNEACYEAEDDGKLNEIIKCITFLENC